LQDQFLFERKQNKKYYGKETSKKVLVVDCCLSLPLLEQAYFLVCDAPGCDIHSERWRLKMNTLA
jgi:hypothetical protein